VIHKTLELGLDIQTYHHCVVNFTRGQ